ncbi:MAG TPA: hypothetical protein VLV78_11125 [Thermoanaerobaculia bacterium]|nr:hypothetical protein [Thermoanaerobaculia bacterium]
MKSSPSVVIWRVRRAHHQYRCIVEQLAEECFALQMFRGHELVLTEFFDEPGPLLARADVLRAEITETHAVAV